MWQFIKTLVVLTFLTTLTTSDWVEIPQVSSQTSQSIFGSHRTSLQENDFPFTTTSNYETLMKTPVITFGPSTTSDLLQTSPVTNDDIMENREDKVDVSTEETAKLYSVNKTIDSNYSGFLPLLTNIQETLTRNAKKTLKSKITLLRNIRDNLLANIDERMSVFWKKSNNLPSEARGHYDDHEMDFPSNEGALMTIGFLTFAVFLIKLVLKLIHALKYKNNNGMVAMPTMAGTDAATAYFGRKRRDIEKNYDAMKILQFIEEYKFR